MSVFLKLRTVRRYISSTLSLHGAQIKFLFEIIYGQMHRWTNVEHDVMFDVFCGFV
jgi:hypothetical protein